MAQDPFIGDEEPESLINNFPNILLEQRFDSLEKKVNIAKESSLFPPGSYINPTEDTDGLIYSKFQPILSIKNKGETIPLFINARNSGLPYYLFKQITKLISFKTTKIFFDILIGTGTLIFFYLTCLRKFSNVSELATIILSSSPLLSTSMTVYIGEQLLPLLFWMILYFIERSSKEKIIACVLFLIGIHIKLNYVFLFIPLFALAPRAFTQNKKHTLVTGICAIVYILIILNLPFSENELLSSSHYIKPISHLTFVMQEMLVFLVAPIKFLTMYVETTGLTYLHEKSTINLIPLLSLGPLELLNLILILPCLFITTQKNSDHRKVLFVFIFWCLSIFVLANLDKSYTYRIITINSFVSLLIAFAVLTAHKIYKPIAVTMMTLQVIFSFIWIYQFNKIGPDDGISTALHLKVAEYLKDKNIKTPLITGSKTPWGILELLSNEEITPIYFNSYHRNIPLKKAFRITEGEFLIHMPIKRTRTVVHYDPNYDGYSKSEIKNIAKDEKVTLIPRKEFYHKGKLIYWLVSIKQQSRKFYLLNDKEKSILERIDLKENYR